MSLNYKLLLLCAFIVPVFSACSGEQVVEDVKEWELVASLSADTMVQGDTFELKTDKQKISYSVDVDEFGVCGGYVLPEGTSLALEGGLPIFLVTEGFEAETFARMPAGTYYISLQTSVPCSMWVYERR